VSLPVPPKFTARSRATNDAIGTILWAIRRIATASTLSLGRRYHPRADNPSVNRKRKASHRKLRLLPSRIRKLLPSTVPNNVTVINTRDEHGGRLYPGWHIRGRVWVVHHRSTGVKENKKGAFKPP
jgi:hypothetical protein